MVLDPVDGSVGEDLLSLLDVELEELSDFDSEFDSLVVVSDDEVPALVRSEEHTSELQSLVTLVCRLLLEKKKYP